MSLSTDKQNAQNHLVGQSDRHVEEAPDAQLGCIFLFVDSSVAAACNGAEPDNTASFPERECCPIAHRTVVYMGMIHQCEVTIIALVG
jgi:hypothetical protein